MEKEIQYRFYPTLLNMFQRYLDSYIDAEDFYNLDDGGNYKITPDQMCQTRMQELLNCINRVPQKTTEQQARGTAFNEIIDCIVNNRNSSREDTIIKSETLPTGKEVITANIEEYTFHFDKDNCISIAKTFTDCTPQVFCQANLPTYYGIVELYGYADEINKNKIYDIKTTSKYKYPKYEKNIQKDLYPYCLIENGDMQECRSFEFSIFVPKINDDIIKMTTEKEEYTYNHMHAIERLKNLCEPFIEWLETQRDLITNKKIFGE